MTRAGTAIAALGKVEKLLLRIGRKQQQFQAVKDEMEQRIEAIRAEYRDRLEGRGETIKKLEGQLQEVCEQERQALLDEDEKSAATLFGRVGWRKGRDTIRRTEERSADEVAEALINRGYESLVKIKRSPSRSAVRRALKNGRIQGETLEAVGLEFHPGGEDWYYKVDASAVRQYLREQEEDVLDDD